MVVGGCGGSFCFLLDPLERLLGPSGRSWEAFGVWGVALEVPGATWGSVWALWVRLGTSMGGGGRYFGLCWPLFGHLGPLAGFI